MENKQIDIIKIINDGKLVKKLTAQSSKFNNEAYLYKWLDNYYVVRKVGKQYDLSIRMLNILEKNINTYHEFLKLNQVLNLPKIFLTKIDKQQNVILLVTEYFPKGKIVEIRNVSRKIKYFQKTAKLIIKITSSRSNFYLNKLICSIDPNPDNFFIDFQGKLIYNDFTPPLYRKGGKWLEFRRRDEIHTRKSDKEKRYFTELNLLLIFVNKIRIYLPFFDYLKFIRWLSNEINKLDLPLQNPITIFPEVYKGVLGGGILDCHKIEQYATLRDILRFRLTFCKDLPNLRIKRIYKKSKKPGGNEVLIKKLYGKDKDSYSGGR